VSSRHEVEDVKVQRKLALASQLVTAASPEYDAVTKVVTVTAINVFALAPLVIAGFHWAAAHPADDSDPPEDGDWITLAGYARTSMVVLASKGGEDVGFRVGAGTNLTVVSVDAATDTDALRDLFNADPGYAADGTATTLAPGFISIAWNDAWPVAHTFLDLSTGTAAASGNDDVVQVLSGDGGVPEGTACQGSHGGTVYVDGHARPIQIIYRTKTPDGGDLNQWLVPDWTA